jgi:hypothetical protein
MGQVFVTHQFSNKGLAHRRVQHGSAGQMIGPAVAGLGMAKIGTGWAFLLNGLSFGAVLLSMYLPRVQERGANARASRGPGGFIEGLGYVWTRPNLRSIPVMLFLIGTFGFDFPIFISTVAVNVFHASPNVSILMDA